MNDPNDTLPPDPVASTIPAPPPMMQMVAPAPQFDIEIRITGYEMANGSYADLYALDSPALDDDEQ